MLVAGDISSADTGIPPAPVFEFLDSLGMPVVAVLGNSDRLSFLDDFASLDNVRLLHFGHTRIGGMTVIGASGVQTQDHGAFYYLTESQFYRGLVRAYAEAGRPNHFILLTHAPPYGFADLVPDGKHVGSLGIRRFVDGYHPDIHVCGHIHEASGIYEAGATKVVNPGRITYGQPLAAIELPSLNIGALYLP